MPFSCSNWACSSSAVNATGLHKLPQVAERRVGATEIIDEVGRRIKTFSAFLPHNRPLACSYSAASLPVSTQATSAPRRLVECRSEGDRNATSADVRLTELLTATIYAAIDPPIMSLRSMSRSAAKS